MSAQDSQITTAPTIAPTISGMSRAAKENYRFHHDAEYREKKLQSVRERYHRLKSEPTETFENWKAANLARSKARYVPKKPRVAFM